MSSNIRIVLIETSHPGNIGAVARAMKTMCLDSLVLVSPKIFPSAEATARASGADDLLANAQVCDSLDEALHGCHLVIGASAREDRALRWPVVKPTEGAQHLCAESLRGPVAMIFGRENSGLSNDELSRCHQLMHIPTNPDFASLNLAAAVQLVAWEIRQVQLQGTATVDDDDAHEPATSDEMERFYVGFLDPQSPRYLVPRMRRLFNRARPEQTEINILRGILTASQRHVPKESEVS